MVSRQLTIFKSFHLSKRFFYACGLVILVFCLGFPFPFLVPIAQVLLVVLTVGLLADGVIVFQQKQATHATRRIGKILSLGDDNPVHLKVFNLHFIPLHLVIFDELPEEIQIRNFQMRVRLEPGDRVDLSYSIRPLTRGSYSFGNINLIVQSGIGLVKRHQCIQSQIEVPVYPSIVQMKKFELQAFAKVANYVGIKKVRRLGHSYEFEQIKTYVQGDDIRSINWKATSRRNQVMVNQYEDERSQQVYSIIDKSRAMHMPFHGLSLLDYAVNTSLVISNIALKKHDKAGLISFSNAMGSTLRADQSPAQLKKIIHALYNEKPQQAEANYELLYRAVKNVVKSRSLILLYTNFESHYAMERALPILRKINQQHLLVVMMFENTELTNYASKKAEFIDDIYTQTSAQKMVMEKRQMVNKMHKYGIQTLLSRPEDLSLNTVNKYLELKSRGLI